MFWEATKACELKCLHCRAEAIEEPQPGELSTSEAEKFVRSLELFGEPPLLVITGGNPLKRRDLWNILSKTSVPKALSPTVGELLDQSIDEIRRRVRSVSISLDGILDTHDEIRGVEGHFLRTIKAIEKLRSAGVRVQVNTIVIRRNVLELPLILRRIVELGVPAWELFFLVRVGRGLDLKHEDLTPQEYEDVMNFLYEASFYGPMIRTVEGPFFRRVALERSRGIKRASHLYKRIRDKLREVLGSPTLSRARATTFGTRDGKGIIFVSSEGDVYPSGFLPFSLGNIKSRELIDIYRRDELLVKIRRGEFNGKCGICEYKDICGGSRSRAYAEEGDPLGEDPACLYKPRNRTFFARRC